MIIYLDTEFTDFISTELISIGAITEDGKYEFYAEISDYNKTAASQFVKLNVLPLLLGGSYLMSKNEASARFGSWLDELPYEEVVVCIDYSADWELMVDLLDGDLPHNLRGFVLLKQLLNDEIIDHRGMKGRDNKFYEVFRLSMDAYNREFFNHFSKNYMAPGYVQHHALYDARAIREGTLAAIDLIKQAKL